MRRQFIKEVNAYYLFERNKIDGDIPSASRGWWAPPTYAMKMLLNALGIVYLNIIALQRIPRFYAVYLQWRRHTLDDEGEIWEEQYPEWAPSRKFFEGTCGGLLGP
ncbi:predicted protein [Histoplasma capsulatum var. duboisii H88]|uniref:Predicted protein n=2 Tax=Ajellomyces capsulatus TaxID=5037 RepID=F0UPU4_AJEC8|nr:predicted protein [Histoplasma capsulatum H143]EGC47839.1 predicted protein [Histoplasma capsulatum var. duboisii H88]